MNNYLRIVSVSGVQAAEFLQGQISADVSTVNPQQACLGTLCNLKGRMIASFILVNPAQEIYYLVLHQSIAEQTKAELAKYAIFSQCEIELLDIDVSACAKEIELAFTVEVEEQQGIKVALPENRVLFIGQNCEQPLPEHEFIALDIDALLPWVTEQSADKFLPQAFFSDDNVSFMQAISYTKGCYKGQEVVARMHFKGEMKEGLYRLESGYFPAGHEFRDSSGKRLGQVVQSVEGNNAVLAVMRHDSIASFIEQK